MRKRVRIDADALATVGASPVLALLPRALTGAVTLSRGEQQPGERMAVASAAAGPAQPRPPTVGVVRVEGPLAQRASADMCGYIDGYDAVGARLELALADDVDGVLLIVDSPGGDVAGLEESVRRMRAAVERSDKRVVAYVDELAASAAYWIASSVADEIVVPVAGEVGSIGCIGAVADTTERQKQFGWKWTVVREPAGKAESMPYAPIQELVDERLTAAVKGAAGRFFKAVSKSRGLTTRAIRDLNGAVLTGKAAVDAGLADRVGTLESAATAALAPRKKDQGRNRAAQQRSEDMKLHALVCAKLGLDSDASEADVAEAFESTMGAILTASGQKKLAKVASAIEALEEQRDALAVKAAGVDALTAEVAALKSAGEAAERAAEVERIISAGVEARKIAPAKRAGLTEKGMRNGPEWLQSVVDELPVLVGAEVPKAADTSPLAAETEMKPRELAMCAQLGIDPKTYAAQKAALMKKAG
jgi:ClpP class serine protease